MDDSNNLEKSKIDLKKNSTIPNNVLDLVIMGLDISEKRCGVAIYKKNNNTPLKTIKKSKDINVFEEIEKIIKKNDVQLLVIGISLRGDNSLSSRFHFIKHTAHGLYQKTGIRYTLVNEFQSTKLAKKYKDKYPVDAMAAKVILDRFLKSVKKNKIEKNVEPDAQEI